MKWLVLTLGAATAALVAAEPRLPIKDAVLWTPEAVSTRGYESSPTFTPEGREMYFVGADQSFRGFRILRSRCAHGQWSSPEPAPFAAPAPVIEADPFIAPDGRRAYFVSTRHDPRNEDFDVYFVTRRADGSWGKPIRLPPPVNSTASELLPRLDGEGHLYFGSARPGGHGKSDIYRAVEASPGRWQVENVGPPVSTAADEYEAEVSRNGRALVVVADRGNGSHLYRFRQGPMGWKEVGLVPARRDVFQVGPLLSPKGERLLFAQAHGERSGEIFLVDLVVGTKESWPPMCLDRSG
jgi:hypothetical protein